MASGSFDGKFSAQSSKSNVYPRIEWSSSTNVSANQSSVKVILYFMRPNSYWSGSYNNNAPSQTININGNKASSGRSFRLSSSKVKIWERTVTVGHSSNGKKTCVIGASGSTGLGNIGSYNFSKSVTLDTIPRKASFTLNKSSVPFGTAFNCNIKSPSSSFRYTVNVVGLGSTINLQNKGTGGSKNFTISNSYLSRLTNSTSTSVNVWVDTYDGNTKIGANSRSLKLTVPSNITPSVSSISAADTNSKSKALGVYVQKVSTVKLTASASGTYGSSIKNYEFKLGSNKRSGSGNNQSFTAGQLSSSGTVACSVTVKDSRGRTASKSVNISVQAYSPPKITKFTAVRNATTATTVNMTKSGSYSSLGGKNPATWKLEMKLATASTWGASGITVTDSINSFNKTGIKSDASYQFRLSLTDKLGSANSIVDVKTEKVLFDLHRDQGVGIGKMHEKGSLDVGGELWLDGIMMSAPNRWAAGGTDGDGNTNAYPGGTLNAQNSDFTGINGIYFGGGDPTNPDGTDTAQSNGEGILFPHKDTVINWSKAMTSSERDAGWDNFRIQDGIGKLNGSPVMIDTYAPLWEGENRMNASYRITPKVPINQCPNGWLLVWSRWVQGKNPANYDWNYVPIQKYHRVTSGGVRIILPYGSNDSGFCKKYVYVNNNKELAGHDDNLTGNSVNMTLRAVLAF